MEYTQDPNGQSHHKTCYDGFDAYTHASQWHQMSRNKHDSNTEQKQFCERGDTGSSHMLITGYQDEVESKVEDERKRCHNGHLFFLFRAHESSTKHEIDVEKDESRSKCLEYRNSMVEFGS